MKWVIHFGVYLVLVIGAQANCGSPTRTGNGPSTLAYNYTSPYAMETCSWTLTPDLPDSKSMLIMIITEWSQSISGSLILPSNPNTSLTQSDRGRCFRFIQNSTDQCEDRHFKDECSTAIVRLSNETYQVDSMGWGLRFSVSYRFAKCSEAPPSTTTSPENQTEANPVEVTSENDPAKQANEQTGNGVEPPVHQGVESMLIVVSVSVLMLIMNI